MQRYLGLIPLMAVVIGLASGTFLKSASASGPWNGHIVAFTFTTDDGNAENMIWADSAFIPDSLSFTAFVVSDWISDPNKLTESDLVYLHQNGIEIASHGKTHVRLTDVSDAVLNTELVGSAEALEAFIHNSDPSYHCRTFAYPENAHDLHVMAVVAAVGYAAARDGGVSTGWPNASQGQANWEFTTLYEVPPAPGIEYFVGGPAPNAFYSEALTKAKVDTILMLNYPDQNWISTAAHSIADVDGEHLRWILEELQSPNNPVNGDVWIASFGEVSDVYRQGHGLPIPVGVGESTTGIGNMPETGRMELQAAPNPVASSTSLSFTLAEAAPVRLEIIGMNGSHVATLISDTRSAGFQRFAWKGTDDHGVGVAQGVYLARLKVGRAEAVTRLILLNGRSR